MPAPRRGGRIAWPGDFGTRAIIFVDTEEEFDWSKPLSRDNRSVGAINALPAAAARFADWGCPLAYMVDHPVVADPVAAEVIRTLLLSPGAAIGAQLHPWVNPPFDELVAPRNSFPGNLPLALEAAKIDALTNAIEAAFGQRPRAYRAGRYGIGPNTWRLLVERGYRLDSSARARYEYCDEGGPDFRAVGNAAFWAEQASGLIELPLTTVFTGRLNRLGATIYRAACHIPHARGALARSGMVSRVALTPEGMPVDDALEAIRVATGQGERLLVFSFHSPSVAPGHTPYVRDAAGLAVFWRWWDAVFTLLDHLGVASVGLDAVIDAADATR